MATKNKQKITKDLRALEVSDLEQRLADAHKELYQLRLRAVTKELENTASLREGRRQIARIKQALAEKQKPAASAADQI